MNTETELLKRYGPLMSGNELYQALGFNSYRVFYTHFHAGHLEVPVFKLKGRKGWFAKTVDVARWIDSRAS